MSQMIVIAGTAEFPSEEARDACLTGGARFQEATRADEPGCLAYYFAADLVAGTRMTVWELWADEASLAAHFQHENYRDMGAHIGAFKPVSTAFNKYRVDKVNPVYDESHRARADFV